MVNLKLRILEPDPKHGICLNLDIGSREVNGGPDPKHITCSKFGLYMLWMGLEPVLKHSAYLGLKLDLNGP